MDIPQQSQHDNFHNGRTSALELAEIQSEEEPGGFARAALKLLENNFSPIPIAKSTKRPLLKNWSQTCEEPLTADEIAEIVRRHPGAGVAIACGYKGVLAIDIDTDDREVLKAVQRVLGEGGAPRRGRKGVCSFYRLSEDQSVPSRQFKKILDVLGSGRCCIVPPTVHLDGMPYRWLTSATLLNTPLDRLPVVRGR